MSEELGPEATPEEESGNSVDIGEAVEPVSAEHVATSRRVGLIAFLAIIAFVGVLLFAALAPKGQAAGGSLPANPAGYDAPAIEFTMLNSGEKATLADYLGKPVVLNFWASWCVTCKDEAALLGQAEKAWRDKGVVFLGVNIQDQPGAAKAFAAQYGMQYDSFVDSAGISQADWGVTGLPETFFIGPDGRIVSKFVSSIDAQTLEERLSELVG